MLDKYWENQEVKYDYKTKKKNMCVSDCMVFKIRVGRSGFFFKPTSMLLPLKITQTCSTMFLVSNIDQMYKEMKKIVEVGNKHGNGDEFPDFLGIFFWHIKC